MKRPDPKAAALSLARGVGASLAKRESPGQLGINVRSDTKAGVRYADEIVDGNKKYETRDSDSLRPYVNKRMAIVRTGEGPAVAIGEATIGEPIVADRKLFHQLRDQHLVPEGSTFDIKPGSKKYLYPIIDPRRFDAEKSVGTGIVARKVIEKAAGGVAVPDHLKMLAKAASDQRGGPEVAMTQAQRAIGGGVLSFCLEHVGDIYNRMHNTGYGGLDQYGPTEERRGVVLDKIEKTLRTLNQKYGFEREHEENLKANEQYGVENEGQSPETYRSGVDAALSRYAQEHSKLPVYNRPQELARTASIALGEQDFRKAASSLSELKRMAEDHDLWHQEINKVDPASVPKASGGSVEDTLLDSTGKPVHHTPEGVEAFKRWFGDSKSVDEQNRPVVLYRGVRGNVNQSIHAGALDAEPKNKNWATFATTSPSMAATYGAPDFESDEVGALMPVYVKADKLIEFPVRKTEFGNTHDKFEFDMRASRLSPGEVLVARNVVDTGPRTPEAYSVDSEKRYSYPADIYAWGPGTSVKSAVGNDGTFDHPTDITKAEGGGVLSPEEHEKNLSRFMEGVHPLVPRVLQTGTTGDFTAFDPRRANIDSNLGAGIYASNSKEDIAANYAGEGPDLTNRIERKVDEFRDFDEEYTEDELRDIARNELNVHHKGLTMPIHMALKNPVVLGGPHETFYDYSQPYDEDRDEYGEPQGAGAKLHEAFRAAANEFDVHPDEISETGQKLFEHMADHDGIKASDVEHIIKNGMVFAKDPDTGDSANAEILRKTFENLGHDGIVDTTVNRKFGTMKVGFGNAKVPGMTGVTPDTIHYVAFKPTQIKSALGNRGTFDPEDPDITKAGGGEVDEHGIAAPEPFDIDAAKEKYLEDNTAINQRPIEGHDERMLFHFTKDDSDEADFWHEDPAESTEQYGEFDPNRSELGIHLGSRDQAEGRMSAYDIESGLAPRTLPVYASIKKPIRLQDTGNFDWHSVLPQLEAKGVMSFKEAEQFLKDMHPLIEEYGATGEEVTKAGNEDMRRFLKEKGFDGVVYLNRVEGVTKPGKGKSMPTSAAYLDPDLPDDEFRKAYPDAHDSYIIFDPTQAKSAFAREYNPKESELSRAEGGAAETGLEGMELHALNPEHARDMLEVRSVIGKAGGGGAGDGKPVEQPKPQPRKLNNIGLYSHAAEVARKLSPGKIDVNQLIATLKNKGVKQDEIEHAGLNLPAIQGEKIHPKDWADLLDMNAPKFDIRYANTPEYARYALRNFSGTDMAGENYIERLITLQRKPPYQSRDFVESHWPGIPNIVAHLRTQQFDRGLLPLPLLSHPDRDHRVLLMDELQSDWGKKGREKGFDTDESKIEDWQKELAEKYRQAWLKDFEVTNRERENRDPDKEEELFFAQRAAARTLVRVTEALDRVTPISSDVLYDTFISRQEKARSPLSEDTTKQATQTKDTRHPRGPYVDSTEKWTDLGLKYLLHEAANSGMTHVAWTPASEQKARYGSRGPVDYDMIEMTFDNDSGLYSVQGRRKNSGDERATDYLMNNSWVHPEEIKDYFSPAVSKKLLSDDPQNEQFTHFAGHKTYRYDESDLGGPVSVGSTGHDFHYDQNIPRRILALAKQHDPNAKIAPYDGLHEAINGFPALEITPAMRESIKANGFKAFRRGGKVVDVDAALRVARKARGMK